MRIKQKRSVHFVKVASALFLASFLISGCKSISRFTIPNVDFSANGLGKQDSSELRTGDKLPSLSGRSINGKTIKIDLASSQRGLIIFALLPGCPYCRINFKNWRKLRERNDVDFVWIDISGRASERYLTSFGIDKNDTFLLPDEATSRELRISGTPTTVFVDRTGTVRWTQNGVIEAKDMMTLDRLSG